MENKLIERIIKVLREASDCIGMQKFELEEEVPEGDYDVEEECNNLIKELEISQNNGK